MTVGTAAPARRVTRSLARWATAVVDPRRLTLGIPRLGWFLADWARYARLAGAERPRLRDAHPCLWDRAARHPWDAHYRWQFIWAFRHVLASGAPDHVDIGSALEYVTAVTAVTHVTFVDLRPLPVALPNLSMRPGTVLALPFDDRSVSSLSCLHVVEHVGLGRYGDALDPDGTRKALRELARVLAVGGTLYLSLPVGRPRVCFNAHRVHAAAQIVKELDGLELVEFSGVDDAGRFEEHRRLEALDDAEYACGFFRFVRSR